MTPTDERWRDVGALADIPIRGARIVKTPGRCIAVFRTDETSAYAIDDTCPHKKGPLSQGIVHGGSVTCPLHNWVISLETGMVLGADIGSVRTFALKIASGRILIDVSGIDAARAA